MQKNKASELGSEVASKSFPTIDDVKRKAEELAADLEKLSQYTYPLDVRRGIRRRKGVMSMEREKDSRQIKASSRTYFFDLKETKDGKPYLVVTESRFKGENKQRERNTITIFPEDAKAFGDVISEMIAKLNP